MKGLQKFEIFKIGNAEMKGICGGVVEYYWACDDDYDKIAYMSSTAALNHCLESPTCTHCAKFETPLPQA